ncbi:MAG: maleylpyruvate isomerase family mycothiol-dependent enzyme [Mycobacteriales bacterium]
MATLDAAARRLVESERLADLEAATARLIQTARSMVESDLSTRSLCEGWTRGHVLSHVSRNADGATRLLWWGRTGVPWFQYRSQTLRDQEIDDGAGRTLEEQVTDLEESAARVLAEGRELAAEDWERPIRWLSGNEQPARSVLAARLAEVEYHHVDLDAGYSFADWPSNYLARQVELIARRLTPRTATDFEVLAEDVDVRAAVGAGVPEQTVAGSAADLVGWLSGRSRGSRLSVTPSGPLPSPPPYG